MGRLDNILPVEVEEIRQTCTACPSQWEGRTTDERPIYIRYRWGVLSVRLGPPGGDLPSAVDGPELYCSEECGDGNGVIELDEVCKVAGLVLKQTAAA